MIKAIIFDFGGVLAEEGFREGLYAIANRNKLNPLSFFELAEELIYETGYIIGMADESAFWDAMRKGSGITEADKALREEILKRFLLRHEILKQVEHLRAHGLITAILSDQTNWLEEINEKTPFYQHFHYIFNSFKIKKGKRDSSVFRDISKTMGIKPDEAVFIDDNIDNINRASAEGLKTIYFKDITGFKKGLSEILSNPS